MKDRILRLCKRLKNFSLDDLETISEIDVEKLEFIVDQLLKENLLIKNENGYTFNKKNNKTKNSSQFFLQFHSKDEINNIIKGFCADIEVLKMINLFDLSETTMQRFYGYFRTLMYEQQKIELLKHFRNKPKMPQERVYMNKKVYLYLYNHKLYVSEKYLECKEARKHTEQERLEIKNIYLRSYRKVLSKAYEQKFHLHLSSEIWKFGKDFKEQFHLLSKMIA